MATPRPNETTAAAPAAPRRPVANGPGRPRSEAVDDAVLRAAIDLFFEHGVHGASIEKIAKRAGVAKTTIYRRWPTREALLAQAIEAYRSTLVPADEIIEQTAPEDFPNLLVAASGAAVQPNLRRLMTRLIGSVADLPSLVTVYRESYFEPRRRMFVRALARMQEADLVSKDTDVDLLADMLIGALMQRLLMPPSGTDTPEDFRAYLTRLLRQAGGPRLGV